MATKNDRCSICKKSSPPQKNTPDFKYTKDLMIGCDVCDKWIHCSCANITHEVYKSENAKGRNSHYICDLCRPRGIFIDGNSTSSAINNLRNSIGMLRDDFKIAELTKTIDDLTLKYKKLLLDYKRTSETQKSLGKTVEELKSCIQDVTNDENFLSKKETIDSNLEKVSHNLAVLDSYVCDQNKYKISISNVPQGKKENLALLFSRICSSIGFRLEQNMIKKQFRVSKRLDVCMESNRLNYLQHKPTPILVEFASTEFKREFLRCYFVNKNAAVLSNIGICLPQRFYVNDLLTKNFHMVRNLASFYKKHGKITTIFVKNNRVIVTVPYEGKKKFAVKDIKHLEELVGQSWTSANMSYARANNADDVNHTHAAVLCPAMLPRSVKLSVLPNKRIEYLDDSEYLPQNSALLADSSTSAMNCSNASIATTPAETLNAGLTSNTAHSTVTSNKSPFSADCSSIANGTNLSNGSDFTRRTLRPSRISPPTANPVKKLPWNRATLGKNTTSIVQQHMKSDSTSNRASSTTLLPNTSQNPPNQTLNVATNRATLARFSATHTFQRRTTVTTGIGPTHPTK